MKSKLRLLRLVVYSIAFLFIFFGCTPPAPVPEKEKPVVTAQVSDEAPDSLRFCATIARPKSKSRAVADPHQYWPQKKVLRVGFLSNPVTGAPTKAQIDYLQSAAAEWDTLTNLSFTYPATSPYDIRWRL